MSKFIVVGANGGIGNALCKILTSSEHEVFKIGRNSGDYPCDFSSEEQVEKLVKENDFADYAGVVNLAGSILIKPIQRITMAELMETISQNFITAFLTVKYFAPIFAARGNGSIVLMSTVATQIGLSNHEAIAAAKGAVNSLVISAAASFAAKKVRVNAVAPSLVNTPLGQRFLGTEVMRHALAANHPLGRYGEPEDIASLVAWLLDEKNSWITGQIIGIDGGMGRVKKL